MSKLKELVNIPHVPKYIHFMRKFDGLIAGNLIKYLSRFSLAVSCPPFFDSQPPNTMGKLIFSLLLKTPMLFIIFPIFFIIRCLFPMHMFILSLVNKVLPLNYIKNQSYNYQTLLFVISLSFYLGFTFFLSVPTIKLIARNVNDGTIFLAGIFAVIWMMPALFALLANVENVLNMLQLHVATPPIKKASFVSKLNDFLNKKIDLED